MISGKVANSFDKNQFFLLKDFYLTHKDNFKAKNITLTFKSSKTGENKEEEKEDLYDNFDKTDKVAKRRFQKKLKKQFSIDFPSIEDEIKAEKEKKKALQKIKIK